MDSLSQADAAEVFDFVCQFEGDLERGAPRPLAEYLARFPDAQAAVAAEYLRLMEARTRAAAGDGADGGDDGGGAQRVGPYLLGAELGRGGQGAVFVAEDTRIRREVALKLLSGGFVTEERRTRLRREAQALAGLAHPGICAVLEAEVGGDVPFLAMPLLRGEDLGSVVLRARAARDVEGVDGDDPRAGLRLPCIPRDRRELHRVLEFFEGAARALHAAHEAGVVHRDVKPGNVFVDAEARPVLLDFGLARDDAHDEDALTRTGEVFGTPAYMSPEQLSGRTRRVDRRTDVYALGVSLYEALCGERPFTGASRFALERAILQDPPPDPRARNPVLTEDVRVVLETALEKDPARRYPTALALAEDLRRIRQHEPVHARPAGPGLRLARWCRRNPALATAFVGLTASLVVALVLLRRVSDALDLARGQLLRQRVPLLEERSPAAALALALEAARLAPDYRVRGALYGPLESSFLARVHDEPDGARFLSIATGGGLLAATTEGGRLEVWSDDDGRALGSVAITGGPLGTGEFPLALGGPGPLLVCGTPDGRVHAFGPDLAPRWSVAPEPGRAVRAVGVQGDGARAWAQLAGGDVLLLDAASGALDVRVPVAAGLDADEAVPGAVALSDDGARLVTGPGRGPTDAATPGSSATRLWDARDGRALARLDAAGDETVQVALCGGRVVLATRRGEVRVHSLADGRAEGAPLRVPARLQHLVPDGSGARAVALADPRPIPGATPEARGPIERAYLLDLGSGDVRALARSAAPLVCAAFSPDGARVALAGADARVLVHGVTTPGPGLELRGYIRPVDLGWSADGARLVVHNLSPRLHVFDRRPGSGAFRVPGERAAGRWCGFTPDGRVLLVGDARGGLRAHAAPSDERADERADGPEPGALLGRAPLGVHRGPIAGGECDPDGTRLLSWSEDGAVALRRLPGLRPLGAPLALGVRPRAVRLGPDGRSALVLGGGTADDAPGVVELWRHLDGPEPRAVRIPRAEPARCSAPLADDVWVLAGDGPRLDLFAWSTGEVLGAVELEPRLPAGQVPGGVDDAIFHVSDLVPERDGGGLLLTGSDGWVRRLDAGTREVRALFDARTYRPGWIRAGAGAVVTLPAQGTGALGWGAGEEPVRPELAHRGAVRSLDLDASGRRVLTASEDGTCLVWDLAAGEVVARYDPGRGPLTWAAFDPRGGLDGRPERVACVGEDGELALWPLDPVPVAEARLGRPLDDWERQAELRD